MKIGFIGAGRVGCSFGKYLKEKDFEISGYLSRNYENAKLAADFTDSLCFGDFYSLLENSDIIFVTVSDSAISNVWDKLSFEDLKGKYVCHCSGALTSEIFEGALEKGAFVCSVHPMLAVSDRFSDFKKFAGAFFTVEGNEKAYSLIKKILEDAGNTVKIIENPQKKSLYHLSCALQSNLINVLVYMGTSFLKECGFEEDEAVQAVKPLIRGNLENIFLKGPIGALTGPVERGDVSTVKKHIELLKNDDKVIYKLLSKKLVEIAEIKNPDTCYDKMKKILEG